MAAEHSNVADRRWAPWHWGKADFAQMLTAAGITWLDVCYDTEDTPTSASSEAASTSAPTSAPTSASPSTPGLPPAPCWWYQVFITMPHREVFGDGDETWETFPRNVLALYQGSACARSRCSRCTRSSSTASLRLHGASSCCHESEAFLFSSFFKLHLP